MNTNNAFWGLIFIVLGSVLILYALSYFIFPFAAAFVGFMLVDYGLRLRNKPSLFILVKRNISSFRH